MDERKVVKCLVWDLDQTLWAGILLENESTALKSGVLAVIQELDNRGILQSVASKNDYRSVMNKLIQLDIDQYFLYPQIGWQPKSESIKTIAEMLNIHIESIAFIDDQVFEREEVAFTFPEVLCLGAEEIGNLLHLPEFHPACITPDAKLRRKAYQDESRRKEDEKLFAGTKEEFLRTLQIRLSLSIATESDLHRVEELTIRTHQLNSTGQTYSYHELKEMISSENFMIYVAELEDIYGTYGKIALMIIEKKESIWTLKLILTSCRVISRGVGTILLNFLLQMAQKARVGLMAEYLPTECNRMMYLTYKLAGFQECEKRDDVIILKHNLKKIPMFPSYMQVVER